MKKNVLKKVAVFLDRDGVLNRKPPEGDYVKNFEEFYWNRGAKLLLKAINGRKFLTVIVTNQRGIALGKMSAEFVEALHGKMNDDLRKIGAYIDAFYYCPHEKDSCDCRKPKPGLFFQAAKDLDIDLKRSYFIGDSESDLQAGKSAGCRVILVKQNKVKAKEIIKFIS